nr:MAG TPA: hypothetical protein [Caudoviricetes sp.]
MDEKKIIARLYNGWREAKNKAERTARLEGDMLLARRLRACNVFTGEEATLAEVVAKLHSIEGLEFLLLSGFPTLDLFREYKEALPEGCGVYVDAGEIGLGDTLDAILVGDTHATGQYKQTKCHKITAVYGASATVDAYEFAVVRPRYDEASRVEVRRHDNAIIL